MHWNLRIIKRVFPAGDFFGVHEVYYDKDDKPFMYTQDPVDVSGEDVDDMVALWCLMHEAFTMPILTPKDFPVLTSENIPD